MPLSPNLRAALFMSVSMAGFTVNDAIAKYVSSSMNMGQVMLIRGLFATLFVGLIAWHQGALRSPRFMLHPMVAMRVLCEALGTICFFIALAQLPIATVSAVLQALPLAVTMGAALVLDEPVGWRRWVAIAAGFAGVTIIVRPGMEGFNAYALLALVCVGFCAVRDLATKRIPHEIPSLFISTVTAAAVTVCGALLIEPMGGWQPPAASDIALLAVGLVLLLVGYQFIIKAMRVGEISFVAPFRYTALLWSILLGYLVFADVPDAAMILGSTIIVGSGLYTLYREQVVGQVEGRLGEHEPGHGAGRAVMTRRHEQPEPRLGDAGHGGGDRPAGDERVPAVAAGEWHATSTPTTPSCSLRCRSTSPRRPCCSFSSARPRTASAAVRSCSSASPSSSPARSARSTRRRSRCCSPAACCRPSRRPAWSSRAPSCATRSSTAEAASKIGYITMGMSVVPMIGPDDRRLPRRALRLAGQLLAHPRLRTGHRSPSSMPISSRPTATSRRALRRSSAPIPSCSQSPRFWGYTATAAFTSGAFFAFLGGGPFVATEMLGLTPSEYGFYFGIIAVGYMLGNFLSGRFSQRFGINRMMLTGNVMATAGMALAIAALQRRDLSSAVAVRAGLLHRHGQRHHAAQRQCRHRQRQAASRRLGLGPGRSHDGRRRRGPFGAGRRLARRAVRTVPAALDDAPVVGGRAVLSTL